MFAAVATAARAVEQQPLLRFCLGPTVLIGGWLRMKSGVAMTIARLCISYLQGDGVIRPRVEEELL